MGRFQGLPVNETEQWGKDYAKETVQEVYEHASGWSDWNDVIRWLDEESEADDKLNPGEIASMKEDFQELIQQGAPYTNNAGKAFEMAHKNRLRKMNDYQQGPSGGVV